MAGPAFAVKGLTFASLQAALCDLYFRFDGMTQNEFNDSLRWVVPMQHNFFNRLVPDGQDTVIQYWIRSDDRLTQDYNVGNYNSVNKVADCVVRYIGARAEVWAKAFHHLTKNQHIHEIFLAYCNVSMLEYVGPIVPTNVDYFGTANATTAYTVNFRARYDEVIDFSAGKRGADELEYLAFAPGQIRIEGGI